jgi:hypothetical protein
MGSLGRSGQMAAVADAARDLERHMEGGPGGNDVNCRFQKRHKNVSEIDPGNVPEG